MAAFDTWLKREYPHIHSKGPAHAGYQRMRHAWDSSNVYAQRIIDGKTVVGCDCLGCVKLRQAVRAIRRVAKPE